MSRPEWRRELPVLVPEAQAIGSVAVIRSLGRAGYPVYAASADASAIGLRSRYATQTLVSPRYDDPEYIPWLREVTHRYGIRAVVPSEGFLHSIRSVFEEFARLIPLPEAMTKVFAAMSKHDVFARFNASALREHLPPSRIALRGDVFPAPDECESLGYPVFAKVDRVYADGYGENAVVKFEDFGSLSEGLRKLLTRYSRVLLQGYVPGIGVGAFLLRWDNVELAHFMHRRIHEVPHTGGASSYRAAWFHQRVLDDARRRLEALQWQGVAMLEYRWDRASDKFWLIELNARFWGSLHLALFAGVDFPCILVDAFFGRLRRIDTYDREIASRLTFPREVEYVLSRLRDGGLSVRERLWPVAEFFFLGARRGVRADLWFPGDRLLYFVSIQQTVNKLLARK